MFLFFCFFVWCWTSSYFPHNYFVSTFSSVRFLCLLLLYFVSNTWFICLLYSGYVVEHMNTHRRTNLATLSVYLHSLYLLTFICSVSFIQALAVLFSCTEHEGDEGAAGAMAYNSRQTPLFSIKWTEQISWYEFTQADVWSHDTLADQMHALFWSPRWPSQQFQHLNLVRRQKILFYFFEGFLNQSTLDFFFSLKWEVFGSQTCSKHIESLCETNVLGLQRAGFEDI